MGIIQIQRPDICGKSGRSATINVGPILLGSGILNLNTTEHIPQSQPSKQESNFVGIEKLASAETETVPPLTF